MFSMISKCNRRLELVNLPIKSIQLVYKCLSALLVILSYTGALWFRRFFMILWRTIYLISGRGSGGNIWRGKTRELQCNGYRKKSAQTETLLEVRKQMVVKFVLSFFSICLRELSSRERFSHNLMRHLFDE